jgi:hypothetical protein
MNDSDFLWRMYKYKEKEWLKETERFRLHRRGCPRTAGISGALGRILGHAAKRLVSPGLSLQNRYGAALKRTRAV